MSWDQYSQTPASNYVSPYAFTGMAPSLVKVAISNVMADLSQFMSLPTSGGTANAQTVTNTRQFAALFAGMRQSFIPGNTNTGAVTFAPDGLTAKNVFANGVAAIAGMIAANVPAHLQYDGTQWNLINPQRSTGSATVTLNVGTNTATGTLNYAIGNDGQTVDAEFRGAFSTTSNATTLTLTNIPAILSSASAKRAAAILENTGSLVNGWFSGMNGTTWTGGVGTNAGGFANPGTNGVLPCVVHYTLG